LYAKNDEGAMTMQIPIGQLCSTLTLLICAQPAVAQVITLREHILLDAPVVRVGDVADVCADNSAAGEKLSALQLMPAPAPGTRRYLQRREVADLLIARGVALPRIRLAGADRIEIVSRAADPQSSQLPTPNPRAGMNRHEAILAGQSGAEPNHASATSDVTTWREELNQAIASYLSVTANQSTTWQVNCEVAQRHWALFESATSRIEIQGGSPPWTGRQRLVARIRMPNGSVQVPVYAEVTATSSPVVVALQAIGRGELITAAHVALEEVDGVPVDNGRRAAVRSIEELVGMEARQPIRAGDVVFTDQIQSPVLVKRGELITILSQAGGIRVRTTARSRTEGAHGDLVQVESLETREQFEARVVGLREAAVFAQSHVQTVQRAGMRK
jgi:flagella basal body P-ring formation protein FlgA